MFFFFFFFQAEDGIRDVAVTGVQTCALPIYEHTGNVGCSPLPCMLMRALSVHIAHETAGAARTRHSLRPLYFRGRRLLANLGHFVPRECECVSWRDVSKRLRHPEVRALRRTCAVGRASKDESATDGLVVLRGAQERAPQDDGL